MSKSVCRTCLSANIRMHDLKNTKLQHIFENLIGTKLSAEEGGCSVCYICFVQLQRASRFVDMSRRVDQMFRQARTRGIQIVPESIKALRSTNNFIRTPVSCMSLPEPARQTLELVSVKVEPADVKDDAEYHNLFENVKIEDPASADEQINEDDQETVNIKMFKAESYACGTCNKTYESQSSCQRHVARAHRQFPYNCKECFKGFNRFDSLIRHSNTHREESPYSCDTCDMTFINKIMYINHIRKHTKPHSCHLCDKTFSELSSLRKHRTSHSADKPYTCDTCSKSFSHRSFLIVHLRSHTGEKPFACGFCDKTFAQSGHRISHERSHTNVKPFSCTVCSKLFAERSTLKKHMKTHTPLKPYTCEMCHRTFSNQVAVTSHMARHNENKVNAKRLFLCEWEGCEKFFSTRGNMMKHLKRHKKNL